MSNTEQSGGYGLSMIYSCCGAAWFGERSKAGATCSECGREVKGDPLSAYDRSLLRGEGSNLGNVGLGSGGGMWVLRWKR
jgi:hypothetical protein